MLGDDAETEDEDAEQGDRADLAIALDAPAFLGPAAEGLGRKHAGKSLGDVGGSEAGTVGEVRGWEERSRDLGESSARSGSLRSRGRGGHPGDVVDRRYGLGSLRASLHGKGTTGDGKGSRGAHPMPDGSTSGSAKTTRSAR